MDTPRHGDDTRFLDALKGLSKSLLEGLNQRFDLFSLELEEEKQRLLTVLIVSLVAVFAAFMAFLCLNLVIVLLTWDSNRLLAVGLLAGFYLVLALGAGLWIRQRITNAPQPFAASLEEFRRDTETMTGKDA